MVNKIFLALMRNPFLIILPIAGIMLVWASTLLLQPDINKMADIYAGISDFESFGRSFDLQDMAFIMSASRKSSLFSLLYYIIFAVFIAGYGNMQAAVVNGGKALFKVFLFGIRRFIGKVILSMLILAALIFGISFIISITAVSVFIGHVLTNELSYVGFIETLKSLQLISYIITLFAYPLIILWLPAIFLDREAGAIACFKSGLRAGVRNYFLMLPAVIVMGLPLLLLYIFSRDMFGIIMNPYHPLIYPYQMIVVPVIITYLFFRYDQLKKKKFIYEETCP